MNETFKPEMLNYQLTYADILDTFRESFLNQMLFISVVLVLLNLYAFMYTRRLETPSYMDIANGVEITTDIKGMMLLKSVSTISLVVSLFFPILIVGYKTGWYI